MSEIVKAIEDKITPLLNADGLELVDLIYQKGPMGWTLLIMLDKVGGISLDDCAAWSQKIEPVLDELNIIPNAYNLEISSPGINRPLKKVADYLKFIGERITVKLYAPMDGQKNFHGALIEADNSGVVMNDESRGRVEIAYEKMAKAMLDPLINI